MKYLLGLFALAGFTLAAPPNFVVLFCDDLGYGDLGCFGNPVIRTPHLDRMAHEGQKWTEFYVAASVCTPSRAGLITGRYPIRSGMCSDRRAVLFPDSASGLPASELTIAEALKPKGYATAAVGKWHLGHLPDYLPPKHGFDSYWGIPYSNDMARDSQAPRNRTELFWSPKSEYWNVPIVKNLDEIEKPADQTTLTKRYTEQGIQFIQANRETPFFLYLAHSLPHVPLFVSEAFENRSRRGLYGDVIEEIDWSVGQILDTLRETGLEQNTLVVFTSDNGPWLTFKDHGGSAGLLREGKGCTFEGGMREPTIFWGGMVKPKVVQEMGSTLDLLPTFAAMAGADLPEGHVLDGGDLSPALNGTGPSPRDHMIYYHGQQIFAVRQGDFKAHFKTKIRYTGQREAEVHNPPLLYHLGVDPGEKEDVAAKHPEVIDELTHLMQAHAKTVVPVEDQLMKRMGK